MASGELNTGPATEPSHRSVLCVWSDAQGWRATIQCAAETPRTFRDPDDALLFLYSCLLGRQEAGPPGEPFPWTDPELH